MGCAIEFFGLQNQVEFCAEGSKQKILIDILLKFNEMDVDELAVLLGITTNKIQDIYDDKDFLVGYQADNLSQIFLRFFGQKFFQKFSIIRTFASNRS